MRRHRTIKYFSLKAPGLLVAILLFFSGLPLGASFAYAENYNAGSISAEETLPIREETLPTEEETLLIEEETPLIDKETLPIDPEAPGIIQDDDPEDPADPFGASPTLFPEETQLDEGVISEVAGTDMIQTQETQDPYSNVAATIDLSEAHNINLQSTLGYEIKGLDSEGRTYSYYKPSLHDQPLTNPATTNGRIDFYSNASGKTFRLIQTGVRTENSRLTKNGTTIVPLIYISPDVKNITLILEDIDLGQYANNNIYGYISISANATATFLLGTDAGNPSIGSSYIRTTLRVPSGASLTIDSLSSPGSSSGTLTVTPTQAEAAAIGGSSATVGGTSGQIIINGGTVNATQNLTNATGAAIGGGGHETNTSAAGSGYVTINGGTVNATTSGRGAAIGGGGNGAYTATAGAGYVTISGGVVNATNTLYGAAIGGGAAVSIQDHATGKTGHAGGCNISITGGFVTATANRGAAIGSGFIGYLGEPTDNRIIGIGSDANIKAYSSGNNSSLGTYVGFARPAIDIGTLSDSGYFVNAILNTASMKNAPMKLHVQYNGGGPVLDTLTLPANYRNFAYTTGDARTDNIVTYNASDYALLGGIRHDDPDASSEIFSVNTANGYAGHSNNAYALLSVKLDSNNIPPIPERYCVFLGTLETGSFITSLPRLADAIAQCSSSNTLYTIVVTKNDPNMTNGSGNAITIAQNKNIKIMSDKAAPEGAWIVTMQNAARHFDVQGSLTLEKIILDGKSAGGGLSVSGTAAMNSGAVIQNCQADKGGGVYVDGGGLSAAGTAVMNSGAVIKNCQAEKGGGVYVNGGGLSAAGTAVMNSGAVIQNCQAEKGGGVYVDEGGFTMSGTAKLSGNHALNGPGGGIYTVAYADIDIGPNALFGGNAAPAALNLGMSQTQYSSIFPTIHSLYGPYYSTAANHPVNDYDINVLKYTVTVYYIDNHGDPIIAPAPASDVSKVYQMAIGLPFALDGSADRIVPDIEDYYYMYWSVGSPADIQVGKNVLIESVMENIDIYLVYTDTLTTTITVSNTIEGRYADTSKGFLFTMYYYADEHDTEPLTPGGEYTFSLINGQKIDIESVPADVYIRIVVENDSGYYASSFKDSFDQNSTNGYDTGLRYAGFLPRTFDFLNVVETIVPSGIRDSSRNPETPLVFMAIFLISALMLAGRLRRDLHKTSVKQIA